jgi:membrane associated rhomboid family serine protease
MATCYRHPSRETGVACSSCGRPICPDCMTPTPVGMRCPECARERTKVKTARHLRRGGDPVATYVLIAINVAAFLGSSSGGLSLSGSEAGSVYQHGALFGPAIAHQHEYWRLITSGFLHANLLHILFNMYFIYVIGTMLEPAIGTARFLAVYFTALLVGSFGALLFTPNAYTVGASGAAFGLMGCLVVIYRDRGIDLWQSGLGLTILLNLGISLSVRGISIGGHLGGLLGGLIAGWLVVELGEKRRSHLGALLGCAAVGAAGIIGAIAVAGSNGIAPNCIGWG